VLQSSKILYSASEGVYMMNQKKIGQFIKELRKSKEITQEQLAETLNVSGRTVSRWETGNNLPDISLLVEIADFFDVDVRELIEGERKSEMMEEQVREVADKMADYADAEKGKLLRKIQIVGFIGVILSIISIIWQRRSLNIDPAYNFAVKGTMYLSFAVLVMMAIITLYVTGILNRIIRHRVLYLIIKITTIAGLVWGGFCTFILPTLVILLMAFHSEAQKPVVYTDISNYNSYMSFSCNEGEFSEKWGMNEEIWPEKITSDMDVTDFKMVYYNPWNAQYLGYLAVDYSASEYSKEVERLRDIQSTPYIGYFCVEEEKTMELLAINADPTWGLVYALTDGHGKIIYAEQIFAAYYMDLDYENYIPAEYLLDGFNAAKDNGYRAEKMNR